MLSPQKMWLAKLKMMEPQQFKLEEGAEMRASEPRFCHSSMTIKPPPSTSGYKIPPASPPLPPPPPLINPSRPLRLSIVSSLSPSVSPSLDNASSPTTANMSISPSDSLSSSSNPSSVCSDLLFCHEHTSRSHKSVMEDSPEESMSSENNSRSPKIQDDSKGEESEGCFVGLALVDDSGGREVTKDKFEKGHLCCSIPGGNFGCQTAALDYSMKKLGSAIEQKVRDCERLAIESDEATLAESARNGRSLVSRQILYGTLGDMAIGKGPEAGCTTEDSLKEIASNLPRIESWTEPPGGLRSASTVLWNDPDHHHQPDYAIISSSQTVTRPSSSHTCSSSSSCLPLSRTLAQPKSESINYLCKDRKLTGIDLDMRLSIGSRSSGDARGLTLERLNQILEANSVGPSKSSNMLRGTLDTPPEEEERVSRIGNAGHQECSRFNPLGARQPWKPNIISCKRKGPPPVSPLLPTATGPFRTKRNWASGDSVLLSPATSDGDLTEDEYLPSDEILEKADNKGEKGYASRQKRIRESIDSTGTGDPLEATDLELELMNRFQSVGQHQPVKLNFDGVECEITRYQLVDSISEDFKALSSVYPHAMQGHLKEMRRKMKNRDAARRSRTKRDDLLNQLRRQRSHLDHQLKHLQNVMNIYNRLQGKVKKCARKAAMPQQVLNSPTKGASTKVDF